MPTKRYLPPQEVQAILTAHVKWLEGDPAGVRADLRDSNLSTDDLSGADLSDSDIRCADLIRAELIGTNLTGAYLDGANLLGANLAGANLTRANLREVNLSGANLAGANLTGANLVGANLTGANLNGANLSGAHLSASLGPEWALCGWDGHGATNSDLLGVKIDGEIRLFCGRFIGSVEDLRGYIEADRDHYFDSGFAESRTKALDFVLSCLGAQKEITRKGMQVTQPVPPGWRDDPERLKIAEIKNAILEEDPEEDHFSSTAGGHLFREYSPADRCVDFEEIDGLLRLYLHLKAEVFSAWVGPIPDQELLLLFDQRGIPQRPYVDYLDVERVRELILWERGGPVPEWIRPVPEWVRLEPGDA